MEERRLGVQMVVLPEGTTAKQALEMVYRGEIVLSPQQMRAAIECLQFENAKPPSSTFIGITGQSFAEALDRCIARSQSPHVMNAPPALTIEHSPEELKGPMARLERRFG